MLVKHFVSGATSSALPDTVGLVDVYSASSSSLVNKDPCCVNGTCLPTHLEPKGTWKRLAKCVNHGENLSGGDVLNLPQTVRK